MASIHGPSPRFDLERCEQLTRMMAISLSRGNFEAAQRQLTDAINDLFLFNHLKKSKRLCVRFQ